MIGVVVVSHSAALAEAASSLAGQMYPDDAGLKVELAAGTADGGFGTDATAIAAAIERADSGDGVLVLMDLGSAILSAELALEFIDPELAERVKLCAAGLVEGLIAAVVTAAAGATLTEVATEAEGALAAKQQQLGVVPETALAVPPHPPAAAGQAAVAEVDLMVTNLHGLHARPIATLVTALGEFDAAVQLRNATDGRGPVPATSVTRIMGLGVGQGHRLVATATGPQAEQALAALTALVDDRFGESEPAPVEAAPSGIVADQQRSTPRPVLSGLSGQQIVVATAEVQRDQVDLSDYQVCDDELTRLRAAWARVRERLSDHASHDDIFAAQQALLDDLAGEVEARITAGSDAATAVADRLAEAAAEFDSLTDDYLRERGQDLRSLRRQVLAELLGFPTRAQVSGSHILVVDELDAATAAGLDPASTVAVVTLTGGRTGHGVIVASSRGIAMVTGQRDLVVSTGDLVAVDPLAQRVWVNPTDHQVAELRQVATQRSAADTEARARADQPAVSTNGVRVMVEANVGSLADAELGAANGADGSGLVRTEFLFGDWTKAPSAAEQAEVLVAIGRAWSGQAITVRTWDVGADKPLGYLPQETEQNPFLGERGIRAMRRVPEFFDEQLRAIVLASQQVPLRVMFPMITEPEEVSWAQQRLAAIRAELGAEPFPVGMMVEVPAAAVRAGDFADLVDFCSIGTNDLTQYTTAADRTNGVVQHLARPDSEAVFDLISMTCLGMLGVPVAVCGDLASDASATARLIGCGVTELSVRPPLVAQIKQAVREA